MKQVSTGYIILDNESKPQGIDQSAGGYPWSPSDIQQVHIFPDKEIARKYAAHFKGFSVREATITLEY